MSKGMRVIGDIGNARKIHDLAIPVGRELATTLRREHVAVVARLDRRIALEAPEIPLVPPLAERLAEGERRGDALPVNDRRGDERGR